MYCLYSDKTPPGKWAVIYLCVGLCRLCHIFIRLFVELCVIYLYMYFILYDHLRYDKCYRQYLPTKWFSAAAVILWHRSRNSYCTLCALLTYNRQLTITRHKLPVSGWHYRHAGICFWNCISTYFIGILHILHLKHQPAEDNNEQQFVTGSLEFESGEPFLSSCHFLFCELYFACSHYHFIGFRNRPRLTLYIYLIESKV